MSKNTSTMQKPIKAAYWDKSHKIRGLHESVRVYRSPKRLCKEDIEQIDYVSWLRFNHPEMHARCFHVPNETQSSISYQSKLTNMGRNSGIPDLMFIGLPFVIEMKKIINASVRGVQKEKLNISAEAGWFTCVCFGAEAAKLATEDFIKELDISF